MIWSLHRIQKQILVAGVSLACASCAAWGATEVDFTGASPLPPGAYRGVHPENPYLSVARADVAPAASDEGWAVSFFFKDGGGAVARVIWRSAAGDRTLCHNLCEGSRTGNRRTLLVPPELSALPGSVSVEYQGGGFTLQKIVLEAVRLKRVWTTGDWGLSPMWDGEKLLPALQLSGENSEAAPADVWQGDVVTSRLFTLPEHMEAPPEFVVELDRAPAACRMELLLADLPPGATLPVSVNGAHAGFMAVENPSLTDPGYRVSASGVLSYTGWRKATLIVPAELLIAGENVIRIGGGNPASADASARDAAIQLWYPGASTQENQPAEDEEEIEADGDSAEMMGQQ